uniref:Uncharacterized protein n=3 Tax=Rhodnius prolixus TaxID=13249 RepID=T1HRK1_RHOPR
MLMQNIMYPFIRDAHSTSNLTHLHSSVIHHHIMDFINDFWSSNLNRASRTFSVTCAHMATPKILKPLINCSNRRCRVTIMFIKLLFSLLRRFAFHKVVFNQHTKFFFVH